MKSHNVLIFFFLPLLPLCLFAQQSNRPTEIRVQVMDSHTHRPLNHRKVQITFSEMDGQWYPKARNMTQYTHSDGIAIFEITQPLPPKVAVFVWWVYPCAARTDYSIQSAIQDGIAAQWPRTANEKANKWCVADSQAPQLKAESGKIIFFVHPMNRFEWAWYDTWS